MKADRDAKLRDPVFGIFDDNEGAYGRRCIHDEIGMVVGKRRIAFGSKSRKKNKRYDSYKKELFEHPNNKVKQDFPTSLWLLGVTHFEIPTGKLYLSPILGCFGSTIVSRTSSRTANTETANSMLRVAILTTTEKQRSHPMIHSDCGCHCCWPEVDIYL